MRTPLLLSLTACLCISACADHAGNVSVPEGSPPTPINQPDSGAGAPGGTSTTVNNPSGQGSGGQGSGGSGNGGSGGGGTEGGNPVPEPSTLLLVGTGLAGAALLRRRRARPQA